MSNALGEALWSSQAQMAMVANDRIVIERGEGPYVWDDSGRRLLDVGSGLWHCNVGHGREAIAAVAAEQMETLETYHCFGWVANRPALELADRLAALAPIEGAKVFLTSGGGDSTETAAKLARRFWVESGRPRKRTIVTRESSYHGLHAYGTSLTGIDANRSGHGSDSLVPETARVAANDAASLRDLFAERAEEIAAFLLEPVIGTGGFLPPAEGYLAEVQSLCRSHDVLLVVDEVITGFGRTGRWFASERFGLEPDMMLIAKGVTSGYAALGAVLVGERIWQPFWQSPEGPVFRHGLTYSGHATACRVAAANLDILEGERLVERVASLERKLAESLDPLRDDPRVAEIRGPVGLMAGVRFVDGEMAERAARAGLQHGLLMRAVQEGTLGICPPFIIDERDLGDLGERIARVLDSL